MNGSYTTILLRGASDTDAVLASLSELPLAFFVTEDAATGDTVVYPETVASAPHATDLVAALLAARHRDAVVLLAEVQDAEELRLRLWRNGNASDTYIAEPGYATGEELPPQGSAESFCVAFGVADTEMRRELAEVFDAGRYDDVHGFNTAGERHRDIAELLGVSVASVETSYDDLVHGALPEGVTSPSAVRSLPNSGGSSLQEFVVFAAPPGTAEAEIAARFLPQVISFEEEFLAEETPDLGGTKQVQQRFRDAGWNSIAGSALSEYRLRSGSRLIAEFAFGADQKEGSSVCVWNVSGDDDLSSVWEQVCRPVGWGVWSYRTRRVVYPPAA